jgi:hypothetical protein
MIRERRVADVSGVFCARFAETVNRATRGTARSRSTSRLVPGSVIAAMSVACSKSIGRKPSRNPVKSAHALYVVQSRDFGERRLVDLDAVAIFERAQEFDATE